jgi:hypothetical protein
MDEEWRAEAEKWKRIADAEATKTTEEHMPEITKMKVEIKKLKRLLANR